MTVERNYNETFIARLAAREKQIQQNYRPVISVHKWFARRPGSLFRALALAELVDMRVERSYEEAHQLSGVCLDPFMGGGTPLFEAARLGMSVVGYDTNPMARWVVERELEDVDPDVLWEVGEAVAVDVEAQLDRLYRTSCPGCGEDARVRYFLWLRHHRCACGEEHPLLADTMLVSTGLKRHPKEVHICPSCMSVAEYAPGKRAARCRQCKGSYSAGLVAPDSTQFCSCGEPYRVPPQGTIEMPSAHLVAVEYDCSTCALKPGATRHAYKAADDADRGLVHEAGWLAASQPSRFWPTGLIPQGAETKRLLRWGYNQWLDLFNARQLHGLGVLAARIDEEEDGPVKRALQTCFSDFLRFQSMLCRYDRQALKPTDVFAVHGFPVPRVSCEPALLGQRGIGSGGFRHALAKYERAKRWCREPYETVYDSDGRRRRIDMAPEQLTPTLVEDADALANSGEALLRRASLQAGELADESVDIVLTDPPYYANVQYAELMDFCYAWLRRLAPGTSYFDVEGAKTDQDAVGSTSQAGVDLPEFTRRLSEVFCAATAALKPGGAFIFTYHHNDLDAYAPLVVAALDAGLAPTRLYGCPSEMRASKHIHGRNAATVDTVFVLRKAPLSSKAPRFTDVQRAVDARFAALRGAGLKPTEADRACIRHSFLAARAMAHLAATWRTEDDVAARVNTARSALGGLAVPAVAASASETL